MASTGGWFVLAGFLILSFCESVEVDTKGYILYCPCMGRFGNQADHFLGTLAFAKHMDRTLVLPPWVEFKYRFSTQIPFDTYFKVEPLREFHRVMTMEEFMKELAPTVWPVGKRIVFCYQDRGGGCKAKDGNPFGPFWDTFNVNFDKSEFHAPLHFSLQNEQNMKAWNERFPPSEYPVLAFTGAPAAFPVSEPNVQLHKYLKWSDDIETKAKIFIKDYLDGGPFIGVHLRNGSDFRNACNHLSKGHHLFASPQCLGYKLEHGHMTDDICYPSEDIVVAQIRKVAKELNIKTLFVATDVPAQVSKFSGLLSDLKIKVMHQTRGSPHLDLALLAQSDHLIANCASSYSAFAVRERLVNGEKPTSFWAFPTKDHDEL